jgi:hypothetical protein
VYIQVLYADRCPLHQYSLLTYFGSPPFTIGNSGPNEAHSRSTGSKTGTVRGSLDASHQIARNHSRGRDVQKEMERGTTCTRSLEVDWILPMNPSTSRSARLRASTADLPPLENYATMLTTPLKSRSLQARSRPSQVIYHYSTAYATLCIKTKSSQYSLFGATTPPSNFQKTIQPSARPASWDIRNLSVQAPNHVHCIRRAFSPTLVLLRDDMQRPTPTFGDCNM